MWIQLYLIFCSLETLGLFLHTAMEKSLPQEKVLLGYSIERLVLLIIIFLILLFLIYLTWGSLDPAGKTHATIERFLRNSKLTWTAMGACVLLIAGVYLLFTQPPEWFGARQVLFDRMKPLLFWLQTLAWQTFFMLLVWYSVHSIRQPEEMQNPLSIREMNPVLLIFLGAIVLKLMLVLPGTYGLYKDVGESKYFNMIYYLFEGKFYSSADDVTTHYPLFYPLMLLFTYSVKNYTFHCIMALNAIFASNIVFPLYLLARRFLTQKYSLILIAIACVIPFQFLIPNRLLSENLYFPLLLWCVYLAFVLPENPKQRWLWDSLTGLFFGLLYLTRFISLAIIPFLMLIWWLKPFDGVRGIFHLNWKKIGHAFLIIAVTGLVYSPWIFIGIHNGLSLKECLGFGITASTNTQQLTILNLLIWLLLYLAYFILLAAPVLNVFAIAMQVFYPRKIETDENSRWLWSLLFLLMGFSAAVVRHSWRAFYNLEMPERIMGRYVIYFVPLFLLTGFIGISGFRKNRYRSFFHFFSITTLLEFMLVIFSYVLIISAKIIPLGDQFIEPLISIDGFYIQQLGGFFWVFLAILYFGNSYFLWYGRKSAVEFAGCVLAVFYLFAEIDCIDILKRENTFQKLGYTLSESMLNANKGRDEKRDYTIYFSDGIYVDDRKDFAWSLYVRNLDFDWEIIKYPAAEKPQLNDQDGFVIYPLDEMQIPHNEESQFVKINGEQFVVEVNLN
jgi:hypothetical protein